MREDFQQLEDRCYLLAKEAGIELELELDESPYCDPLLCAKYTDIALSIVDGSIAAVRIVILYGGHWSPPTVDCEVIVEDTDDSVVIKRFLEEVESFRKFCAMEEAV